MGNFDVFSLFLDIFKFCIPLVLASMGGLLSERAGILNWGLEGQMLVGAFFGALTSYYTGNPWFGVFVALLSGGLFAFFHAFASIKLKTNQFFSSIAINILALGLATFLLKVFFQKIDMSSSDKMLPDWYMIDPMFSFSPLSLIAILIVGIVWVLLFRTTLGLSFRTIGENPLVVHVSGLNVYKTRYFAVILCGMFAGVAGAYISLSSGEILSPYMISGKGFLAVIAVIIGRWHPFGVVVSVVLFACIDTMSKYSALAGLNLVSTVISILPYLLVLLTLSKWAGKFNPPGVIESYYIKKNY